MAIIAADERTGYHEFTQVEITSTHPDLSKVPNTFPPANEQALNLRRAHGIVGALIEAGFIEIDLTKDEDVQDWKSAVMVVARTLNCQQIKW